ncbi:epimerase [Marinilongibacter aquaticus]|uniref:epimerase n=1 Tax=Marinilongibacter aquaticus TaxID=2975157 RepID=UPI0021BD7FDF|nr:epimerase [Marinilongibacter aquaticus]UBM59885.1 epimerase [Marinilongibacter aquaticus]
MNLKVIITGATGMVGEGALLSCLADSRVSEILVIGRKSCNRSHPKLKELLLADFSELTSHQADLARYEACFFCAGVSSIGKNEEEFTKLTYDLVVPFARTFSEINPKATFIYVSGKGTDSSENGRQMWARVKGKTENDLLKLPFKAVYNFRPGFMKPIRGQKNVPGFAKIFGALHPIWLLLLPDWACTLDEVAKAMLNSTIYGFSKNQIEVPDIKKLAQ